MMLIDEDYYYVRPVKDGRFIFVIPLTFGRARINIGNWAWFDEGW